MNDRLTDRALEPAEFAAFAIICREAASRHGDNWPAIERQIKRCFNALPTDQRECLVREIDRVLRYRAPDRGMQTQ